MTILAVLSAMLITVALDRYLPVGPGEYNRMQIDRIHSLPPSERFSFAVMGDNKNGFAVFRKILKDVDDGHLFAIDVGDLVYNGEKRRYRAFYKMIKDLETPFLVAVGNHDIRKGGAENFLEIFGSLYYSFDYGDSLFIVLDDANGKRIDHVQMRWLERELQKDYRHRFVFMHVPPFDPRPGHSHSLSDRENAEAFMKLMERYKPDIVFTSHIHAYFEETRKGVVYVITGGAGAEIWETDKEHSFHHYVKVEVDGDEVYREVVRILPFDRGRLGMFIYNVWTYLYAFWVTHRLLILLVLTLLLSMKFIPPRRDAVGAVSPLSPPSKEGSAGHKDSRR